MPDLFSVLCGFVVSVHFILKVRVLQFYSFILCPWIMFPKNPCGEELHNKHTDRGPHVIKFQLVIIS